MATRIRLDSPTRGVEIKTAPEGGPKQDYFVVKVGKTIIKTITKNMSTNALWLTAGWTYIVLMIGFMVGNWWWDRLFTGMGMAFVVGFTLYGYMMYHDPKKPFRYTLATICIWVMTGMLVVYLFGEFAGPYVKEKYVEYKTSTPKMSSTSIRPTSCPDRLTVAMRVDQIWNAHLPSPKARRMINAFYIESGGWQFCNESGNILENQSNHDAIGTAQIKRSLHEADAQKLGLSLYDFEQSMQMAVWLYDRDGEAPWKESLDFLEKNPAKVKPIKAPVGLGDGDWSEEVKVNPTCWNEPQGEVWVKNEKDKKFKLPAFNSDQKQPTYRANTVRYSTEKGQPVTVLFKCLRE